MPMARSPVAKGIDAPRHVHTMIDFGGVNTQASRYALPANDFSWLENVMPVGAGNLRCVPAPSAVKATLTGEAINYWMSANINSTDYAFAFCASGAAYQIRLSDYAVTKFAVAGTFQPTGVVACQWKNERICIIDSVAGYMDWNGTTLTVIAAGTKGTTIASYAGRIWIGNNRTVTFTDVSSYTSFAGAGGAFTITDSSLRSSIQTMAVAGGFLYIYGITSVDVVADVRVSGGITLFSRTNLTASVGTGIPQSLFINERSLFFANNYGFYSLRGAIPRKESDEIDTTVSYINFSNPVTGGLCMIFNDLCAAYLFTYNDPLTSARPLLAIHVGNHSGRGKWFFASQGSSLTRILGVSNGNTPKLLGTDGSNIYELFADTTSAISTTIKTPLWDMGDPVIDKRVLKIGVGTVLPANVVTFASTIDTEYFGTDPGQSFTGSNTFIWLNNSGTEFTWKNNLGNTFTWLATGYALMKSDASNIGKRIGVTLTSTSPGYSINNIMLEYMTGARW